MKKLLLGVLLLLACSGIGNATVQKLTTGESIYISTPTSGMTVTNNAVGVGTRYPAYLMDINGTCNAKQYIGNGSGLTGVVAASTIVAGQAGSYFLEDSSSGVVGFEKLNPVPTSQAEEQDSVDLRAPLTTTKTIDQYVSATLNGTSIEAGEWLFAIWRKVDSATSVTGISINVYARTLAGTENLLFTVGTGEIDDTTYTLQEIRYTGLAFSINATDRLMVRYVGYTTRTSTTNVAFTHSGTLRNTFIRSPILRRHNDLSGLDGGGANYYHSNQAINTTSNVTFGSVAVGTSTTETIWIDPVYVSRTNPPSTNILATSGMETLDFKTTGNIRFQHECPEWVSTTEPAYLVVQYCMASVSTANQTIVYGVSYNIVNQGSSFDTAPVSVTGSITPSVNGAIQKFLEIPLANVGNRCSVQVQFNRYGGTAPAMQVLNFGLSYRRNKI